MAARPESQCHAAVDRRNGLVSDQKPSRKPLHPLPKGLVELYGLLAVLVVLIPEWMASGALQGLLAQPGAAAPLPGESVAWRRVPDLRLAAMGLAELRLLARQLGVRGYASLGRDRLSQRVLRILRRRKSAPRRISLVAAVILLLLSLTTVVVGSLLLL